MKADDYRVVDLGDGGEEARRALWRMACGLLALADEKPDARVLPLRGESSWCHELAERHAVGEVATSELVALVQLHYLDEHDEARLAESRADELAARIVELLENGCPILASNGLVAVRDALGLRSSELDGGNDPVGDSSGQLIPRATGSLAPPYGSTPCFRDFELDELEAVLSGHRVRYVPAPIVEDVVAQALSRFRETVEAPEPQASRLIGIALLDLVVTLWRARPFGRSDALAIATFLLLILKDQQIMVNPAPFALDAPYFRNALVRACYSDAASDVREEPRFIGMFLENLYAGGAHRLRLQDTECREYQGLKASNVVGSRRGSYILRIGDMPIAALRFGRSRAGDVSMDALEVDERHRHLMPLNLIRSCDALELERFVKSRVMSRGRAHRGEILGACGISGARTWAIVHSSRGVCATDSYSIVHEGDDIPFSVCGMFDGELDEVLQEVALTGRPVKAGKRAVEQKVLAELATGGRMPKAWRRMDDGSLALFKAAPEEGGGATGAGGSAGRRAAMEALASSIARGMGAGAVAYEVGEWFGRSCSACANFASREVSFVPFALAVTRRELEEAGIEFALDFYRDIGIEAERAFCTMLVLDCLLANPSRTHLDHGVMRDARSGEVLAAAPVFDLDEALFSSVSLCEDAGSGELARRALAMEGLFRGTSLGDQALFALRRGCGEAADAGRSILERALSLDSGDFDIPDLAAEKAVRSIPRIASRILGSA